MATFGAAVMTPLYYAPGNPLFPILPDIDAPVGLRALGAPRIARKLARRTIGGRVGSGIIHGTCPDQFSAWYKGQWWITPNPLDFGNIISEKTLNVTILSTFFDGVHTLNDIDVSALGAGITFSLPSPQTVDTLETVNLDIVANPVGDASFSDNVIFEFDNLNVPILALGRRIVLIPYIPQTPVQEQLSWITDIMKSRDGTEQRHSLRLTPRQTIDYSYLQEDGTDASRLRTILLSVKPLILGIPIWWEAQEVTSATSAGSTLINVATSFIDHRVGSTIIVVRPDGVSFDATIDSFTSTTITTTNPHSLAIPADSLVCPVRLGYILGDPRYSDSAGDGLRTAFRIETIDNVDLEEGSPTVDFPTHPTDGLTILSDPNFMRSRSHRGSVSMEHQRIDNIIGVPAQFLQEDIGDPMLTKGVEIQYSLEEIRKWRAWLHYIRGSWRTFYMPTFRNDLPLTQTIKLSGTSFIAEDTGAATFVGVQPPHRDVMLELPDGRQFFSRVITIVDNGDGTETFTISPNWGSQSPDSDIAIADAKISWMHLARLEGDVATFIHEYVGTTSLRFNTRGVQD
jgi:hypothetical protein